MSSLARVSGVVSAGKRSGPSFGARVNRRQETIKGDCGGGGRRRTGGHLQVHLSFIEFVFEISLKWSGSSWRFLTSSLARVSGVVSAGERSGCPSVQR